MKGKYEGDEALVKTTVRQVCNRLKDEPIRIAEHLCRTEHIKGPHWWNGHDQDAKRASAY